MIMNKNNNILLLGDKGFIGTALAYSLYENKCNVYRATNPDQMEEVLPQCGTVVYLASSLWIFTHGHIEDPLKQVEKNIIPVINFLDVLQKYKDIHFIFISSGGVVYGSPKTISADEDCPLTPISFYGAGKAATEIFLRVFSLERNISIARISNIYGPNQSFQSNFSGVIRTMLEHTLNNSTMEIWGDGGVIRDFLYIDDIISAIMHLIRLPYDNTTYNIGSGDGYSVNQLKGIIESICNKKLNVVYKPERSIDVKAIVLDSSMFMKKTKWRPLVSIEQGVETTWKWLNK